MELRVRLEVGRGGGAVKATEGNEVKRIQEEEEEEEEEKEEEEG